MVELKYQSGQISAKMDPFQSDHGGIEISIRRRSFLAWGTSNRTMVELKYHMRELMLKKGDASNRTMVELKFKNIIYGIRAAFIFQSDHGGIEI